jgi:ectoine hydroxylase-related dioxygenase (phytanoyl-CoA dioxygenase family)
MQAHRSLCGDENVGCGVPYHSRTEAPKSCRWKADHLRPKLAQSFLHRKEMSNYDFYSRRPEHELPEDAVSRADIEHVLKHGFVVLENAFTREQTDEAKAEMIRLSGETPKAGRNPFEGLDTNRIYSLLNKTRVFDKFCINPRVLALNDHFLEPGYAISALHTIQINPGEQAQPLHHDDGFCHIPRPRPALGAAILLAFDDFTEDNGATRIVPGSHDWPTGRLPKQEEAKSMSCAAGSVLYFIGTTWHGGGANRTNKPRMSATVQYCQPYVSILHHSVRCAEYNRSVL